MKTDFRKISIKDIEGNLQEIDLDYKGLANCIYNTSKSITGLELARELHKEGIAELDAEQAAIVKNAVSECFGPLVHESLFPILDEIINNQNQ